MWAAKVPVPRAADVKAAFTMGSDGVKGSLARDPMLEVDTHPRPMPHRMTKEESATWAAKVHIPNAADVKAAFTMGSDGVKNSLAQAVPMTKGDSHHIPHRTTKDEATAFASRIFNVPAKQAKAHFVLSSDAVKSSLVQPIPQLYAEDNDDDAGRAPAPVTVLAPTAKPPTAPRLTIPPPMPPRACRQRDVSGGGAAAALSPPALMSPLKSAKARRGKVKRAAAGGRATMMATSAAQRKMEMAFGSGFSIGAATEQARGAGANPRPSAPASAATTPRGNVAPTVPRTPATRPPPTPPSAAAGARRKCSDVKAQHLAGSDVWKPTHAASADSKFAAFDRPQRAPYTPAPRAAPVRTRYSDSMRSNFTLG